MVFTVLKRQIFSECRHSKDPDKTACPWCKVPCKYKVQDSSCPQKFAFPDHNLHGGRLSCPRQWKGLAGKSRAEPRSLARHLDEHNELHSGLLTVLPQQHSAALIGISSLLHLMLPEHRGGSKPSHEKLGSCSCLIDGVILNPVS